MQDTFARSTIGRVYCIQESDERAQSLYNKISNYFKRPPEIRVFICPSEPFIERSSVYL